MIAIIARPIVVRPPRRPLVVPSRARAPFPRARARRRRVLVPRRRRARASRRRRRRFRAVVVSSRRRRRRAVARVARRVRAARRGRQRRARVHRGARPTARVAARSADARRGLASRNGHFLHTVVRDYYTTSASYTKTSNAPMKREKCFTSRQTSQYSGLDVRIKTVRMSMYPGATTTRARATSTVGNGCDASRPSDCLPIRRV